MDTPPAPDLALADILAAGIDPDRYTTHPESLEPGADPWYIVTTADGTPAYAFGVTRDPAGDPSWTWGELDEYGHLDEWDGAEPDTAGRNRMLAVVKEWCDRH